MKYDVDMQIWVDHLLVEYTKSDLADEQYKLCNCYFQIENHVLTITVRKLRDKSIEAQAWKVYEDDIKEVYCCEEKRATEFKEVDEPNLKGVFKIVTNDKTFWFKYDTEVDSKTHESLMLVFDSVS